MHCPFCGHEETKVNDSRLAGEGRQIRRRRECLKCGERFTTFETAELVMPLVVKGDRRREAFDEAKLRAGMEKALEKRPVAREQIDEAVSRIVHKVRSLGDREVPSRAVGELVMEELRQLDEVAYVRFASVYRQFEDVEAFHEEIQRLRSTRARPERRRAAASARAVATPAASSCRCCRRPVDPGGGAGAAAEMTAIWKRSAASGIITPPGSLVATMFSDFDRFAMQRALTLAARGLETHAPQPARRLRDRAARPRSSARAGTSAPARRTPRSRRCAPPASRPRGADGLRDARAVQPPRPHAAVRRTR